MKTYFDSAVATANGFQSVNGTITSAYVGVGTIDENTGKRHVIVTVSVFSEGHSRLIKLRRADFSRVLATHTDKNMKDEISAIVDALRDIRDRNAARADARAQYKIEMDNLKVTAMEMFKEGKSIESLNVMKEFIKDNIMNEFNLSSMEDEKDSERKLMMLNGQNILLWHRHLTAGQWKSIDGARSFPVTKEFDEYVIDSMQSTPIEFDFADAESADADDNAAKAE